MPNATMTTGQQISAKASVSNGSPSTLTAGSKGPQPALVVEAMKFPNAKISHENNAESNATAALSRLLSTGFRMMSVLPVIIKAISTMY